MAKKKVEEEKVVEEVKEEKELSDEFVEKKEKKKKSIFSRIINFILTIVVFGWVAIAVIDYINVSQEKEPMFCLEKETIQHEDGTVSLCKGLGYKVYKYNRASIQGTEFGPFWIEERTEPIAD